MKENLISDKSLIYQCYFNDNISVVDNQRIKSTVFGNPTYNNGIATFNGSTDYYKLKTLINLGTKYSIEVKFKLNAISVGDMFVLPQSGITYGLAITSNNRLYHSIQGNTNYINFTRDTNWHTYTIARSGSVGKMYLDGTEQSLNGTGFASLGDLLLQYIGANNRNNFFNGQLEYIKIWNRQLTASEVKNNYNGKTYRALSYKSTTLFHINSDNGVIRDLTGKTTPVPTNVALPKIGSNINVMKFNSSSGNINIGSQALVGDVTFMGWVNLNTFGEGGTNSMFIHNTKFLFGIGTDAGNGYYLSRNAFANAAVYMNQSPFTKTVFICATSASTGITNFYIGDKNNPPTLSGTANQSAGTPVAGSTCYLGNRASDDRTLNGWLNDIIGIQAVITQEEMMQTWSSTKYKYQ